MVVCLDSSVGDEIEGVGLECVKKGKVGWDELSVKRWP